MRKINILFGLLAILACFGISCQANSQEYVEKQTKELNFSKAKVFIIKNIFGNINIEGTKSLTGQLEIEEKIKANSKPDYEKAKKELEVKVEQFGDTVLVYISSPYIEFRRRNGKFDYRMDNYDDDYQFHYNFSVKIPENIELIASTINDGDIYVNGINGKLKTDNVNGSIKLDNVSGQTLVMTVNGGIDVNFNKNPDNYCKFKTINGDIKVLCNKYLSADVCYKSMNGEFYTNYAVTAIESKAVKEKEQKGGSTLYKLGNTPQFRIGSGEIKMSFETLNGDMIVKHP